jgi:hypothetical protein
VYETYNLACLCLGTKDDATFKAQGVRVNGTKYTVLRELGAQTYQAKVSARASWGAAGARDVVPRAVVCLRRTLSVWSAACWHSPPALLLFCAPPRLRTLQLDDGSTPNVTLENVFVLKSRDSGLVVGVKGGYYFAAKYKSDPRSDPSLAVAAALANGFYWAVGAFLCTSRAVLLLANVSLPFWGGFASAVVFIALLLTRVRPCVQAPTHELAPWTACWLCHRVAAAALGAVPENCRRPCFESTFINLLDDSSVAGHGCC